MSSDQDNWVESYKFKLFDKLMDSMIFASYYNYFIIFKWYFFFLQKFKADQLA